MSKTAIYSSEETQKFSDFAESIETQMGATFDDAVSSTNVELSDADMPEKFKAVLDGFQTGGESDSRVRASLVKAVFDGIENYKAQHGVAPTADVIEWATHQAYSVTDQARSELDEKGKAVFDEASSMSSSHDQSSMQPNRAVVAITASISEAIPVANYLPADIKSNEARLIIVEHQAGSDWGDYKKGQSLDGSNSGGTYISSERLIALDDTTGKGVFYAVTGDTNSPKLELIPNRVEIRVNGMHVGGEVPKQGSASASSPLVGSITLEGVNHVMSGVYKSADSEVTATFTPALPANTKVTAIGYADYEKNPENSPLFITNSEKFKLFANTWQARAEQTLEARSQYQNESGIDIASEALMSLRHQYANERHYQVIAMAEAIGENNSATFDYNTDGQSQDKTRARVWIDFLPKLSLLDQQMANKTMDHGVTHLYVDDIMRAQLVGLPTTIFESSGLTARAGIYRLGRIFGQYEVYYNPRAKQMPAGASRVLCVGRSQQVARNPFVLGDAVAPTVIPFLMNKDFRSGAGYHARNFTKINPHQISAQGCAVIDITNIR